MPTQDDIERQQQLLDAHRATLAHFLLQRARLGADHASPGVTNGIAEARAGIAHCKATLRGWGVSLDDHPDDAARPAAQSVDLALAPNTTTQSTARVTLLLEGDVQRFTPEQQAGFVFVLARVVNVSPAQIRIVHIGPGSVKLTLEMPEEVAHRLVSMYLAADPSLRQLRILKVEVPASEVRKDAVRMLRDPVPDFVGREQEIARLVQALSRAAEHGTVAAISGVRGMGGVGKTELAYAVAQRLAPQFPNGQVLVDLQGAGAPLPSALALQLILRAFDPGADFPHDLAQLQGLYRAALAGKRVLILADNAWDAAQVRPLWPPAGCALLITSRQRFTLPGMNAVDLRTLPEDESLRMLLTICPRIRPHAAALGRLCGYLPLALRVSASLLANDDTLRVERYLERLTDERTRLSHLRDPDDPDLDVEASLRLSYDALDGAAQSTLCQFSVFPTSFTLAAAVAVVEVGGDVVALLGMLRRRSMLEWDETTSRYSLHDLVRALAAAQLGDQSDTVRQRYLAWSAQATYQDWIAATEQEARDSLGLQYQTNLEQLWNFLADDLRRVARGWLRSGMATDVETLAMTMFSNIVIALPRLQLDPHGNLRKFLLTVARQGLSSEYRQTFAAGARRQSKAADSAESTPGTLAAHMWPAASTSADESAPYTMPANLLDSQSHNIEERLASQIDHEAVLAAVRAYWPTSLGSVDLQIMQLRWESDPPRPFGEIAELLGPGWTGDAVRQRHRRIMNATRKYLREHGLIDGETQP